MEALIFVFLFVIYLFIRIIFGGNTDKVLVEEGKLQEGIALLEGKYFEEALAFFTLAVNQKPRNAVAWSYLGRCNYHLGRHYLALSHLTKATAMDLEIPEAYLFKGKVLLELGENHSAELELEKAVWHLRNNAEAYFLRGIARIKNGSEENGLKDLKRAIELGDEEAQFMLRKIETLGK